MNQFIEILIFNTRSPVLYFSEEVEMACVHHLSNVDQLIALALMNVQKIKTSIKIIALLAWLV